MRTDLAVLTLGFLVFACPASADGTAELAACQAAADRQEDDAAIAHCSRTLDHDGLSLDDRTLALFLRGRSHFVKGEFDDAIADETEVMRLAPDYPASYLNRAVYRRKKGDIEGAIQDFGEAIRLRPNLPTAYLLRAQAHFDAGDKDRAATDCAAAMRLDPEAYNGLTFQDETGTFVCDAKGAHYQ